MSEMDGYRDVFLAESGEFLEAMNQQQVNTLFYGNPATDPRMYLGLAPRYGTISGAGNAQNIIDAGSVTGNNTSIYLVGWGENSVFGVFPKGSMAGLHHTDQGELTIYDSSGNPFQAYQSHYQWKNGLVVKDWRYVVRIANILVADLTGQTGTQASTAATAIINLMSRAIDRLPAFGSVKPAFYLNRTVFSMLRVAALNKSNACLSIEQGLSQFGTAQSWMSFMGIPLRRVDQLLNTEARVV
jgi:hypothetical protein